VDARRILHGRPSDRSPLDDGPPSWPAARDAVVPLLARSRRPTPLVRLVTVVLEPGLSVGFGVDLGPMFMHVTEELLGGWQTDVGELTRRAVGNLRRLAGRLAPGAAVSARVGVTRLTVLQAPGGWASSLLLAPDLLPRWFGEGDHLVIAPSRNILAALPPVTDERLARWLRDEMAARLPDGLDVPVLRWSGGRLAPVEADPPASAQPATLARRPTRGPAWRARAQGARTTWYTPPDRSVT
jgi:hypothetical protein